MMADLNHPPAARAGPVHRADELLERFDLVEARVQRSAMDVLPGGMKRRLGPSSDDASSAVRGSSSWTEPTTRSSTRAAGTAMWQLIPRKLVAGRCHRPPPPTQYLDEAE